MSEWQLIWVIILIVIGFLFGVLLSLAITYSIYVWMINKSNKIGDTKNTYVNYATHEITYVATKINVNTEKYLDYLRNKRNS